MTVTPRSFTKFPPSPLLVIVSRLKIRFVQQAGIPPLPPSAMGVEHREGLLVPPINFAMILPGVYRSGCPTRENFGFLKKLGLRCLLYIGTEALPADYAKLRSGDVVQETVVMGMEGNKEPFRTMPLEDVTNVLALVLNKEYHPILIHSMKGRHREGVVVGCLRKLQGLSLVSVYAEYDRYCGRYKAQPMDKRYIEYFTPKRKFLRSSLPEAWAGVYVLEPYLTDDDTTDSTETSAKQEPPLPTDTLSASNSLTLKPPPLAACADAR